MGVEIHEGDSYSILKVMMAFGEMVDSVVTDPPYGLVSIVERFGKSESKAAKFATDGAFARSSKNFQGRKWDATGVERDPEFWKLVFAVMKPGAMIVAFSSARTYHHMAVAIEAAGFITHPMIGWCYASGLPKPHHSGLKGWEGWSHGAQVRKPALEPIYVGQKPFSEKSGKANMLKHGVGAVNIDGIRPALLKGEKGDPRGRYPSNVILDGSEEVRRLFPRDGIGSLARVYENYPFEEVPLVYHRKANADDRAGGDHATVKPVGLMRALVRHVTPVGGVTLDPFAGSGATGAAALAEGIDAILIEAEPDYAGFLRNRFGELSPLGIEYLRALGWAV